LTITVSLRREIRHRLAQDGPFLPCPAIDDVHALLLDSMVPAVGLARSAGRHLMRAVCFGNPVLAKLLPVAPCYLSAALPPPSRLNSSSNFASSADRLFSASRSGRRSQVRPSDCLRRQRAIVGVVPRQQHCRNHAAFQLLGRV
jgi:hypothetical protein